MAQQKQKKAKAHAKGLLRILDANFNRVREGLRTSEDIARFILDHARLATQIKSLRHQITAVYKDQVIKSLLDSRDAAGDVGRGADRFEKKRKDWSDVFYANIQRSKEALRVLEEVYKILDLRVSRKMQRLRFKLYDIEKTTASRF